MTPARFLWDIMIDPISATTATALGSGTVYSTKQPEIYCTLGLIGLSGKSSHCQSAFDRMYSSRPPEVPDGALTEYLPRLSV
jgi:hypothetical protein